MNNKPWCVNPFITFSCTSDGKYRLCCQSKIINEYDINNTPIEEFFSSNFMNEIRDEMLSNEYSDKIKKYCEPCITEEKKGVISKRLKDNKNHINKEKTIKSIQQYTLNKNNYDILNIRFLDINMLGNICNFKCVMCWYGSSSRIASENIINNVSINSDSALILPYTTTKNKDAFFNSIYDIFENADKINFYGGELLINPEFEQILDALSYSNNAKNIEVYVLSNASHIPDYIITKKYKFKNFKLIISIDGISDKAEYIRYGTKWKNFNKNINILSKHVDLTFNIAIQLLNIGYMDEIYSYLLDDIKIQNNQIFNCYVNYPDYFDAVNIPYDIKQEYLKKLKNDKHFNLYKDKIVSILENDSFNEQIFKNTINKLKYFDKIRRLNSIKIFPEFKKYY